ncbi:hypothetical protein V6Z11_A11G318200 [Gossypium hirsutum]
MKSQVAAFLGSSFPLLSLDLLHVELKLLVLQDIDVKPHLTSYFRINMIFSSGLSYV